MCVVYLRCFATKGIGDVIVSSDKSKTVVIRRNINWDISQGIITVDATT